MLMQLKKIVVIGLTLATLSFVVYITTHSERTVDRIKIFFNGTSSGITTQVIDKTTDLAVGDISMVELDAHKRYIKSQMERSEKVWQRYIQKREALVGADPSKVNPWPPQMVMYFWDYFLPTFSCPYTIQRIGALGDGGKWVCGFELFENNGDLPDNQKKPCIVYSFGVSVESSFEAEILERTNCEIFTYDASVTKMGPEISGPNPRVRFYKRYLSSEGNGTLGSLLRQNGHAWIDFLKVDIEGGEFDVFNQILDEFAVLPFAQLNLEIHGDVEGRTFPTAYKIWERFERKGLRAFKNEGNHWPCVRAKLRPIYFEYSFINIKGPSQLFS